MSKDMFRDKLREIIFGYRTRAGKIFDIVLLAAIILSLVGVIMDSDKEIHNKNLLLILKK